MRDSQFNLEEYLANPNRKVMTRNGDPVRIICTDRKDLDFPIMIIKVISLQRMAVSMMQKQVGL